MKFVKGEQREGHCKKGSEGSKWRWDGESGKGEGPVLVRGRRALDARVREDKDAVMAVKKWTRY